MGNISEYLKTCAKNVPGNRLTLYINQIRRANSLTVTGGEVTALTITRGTAGIPTGKFRKIQADIDTIKFMNEGAGGASYTETQTLEFKCAKKSTNLVKLKEELADSIPCGLMVIRVDNNGQAWLSGWQAADKGGKERPYSRLETSFDSGAAPDEEDQAAETFRLIRKAGYDELPFAAALNSAILRGATAATGFIAF
jgi:hypothetical protein